MDELKVRVGINSFQLCFKIKSFVFMNEINKL